MGIMRELKRGVREIVTSAGREEKRIRKNIEVRGETARSLVINGLTSMQGVMRMQTFGDGGDRRELPNVLTYGLRSAMVLRDLGVPYADVQNIIDFLISSKFQRGPDSMYHRYFRYSVTSTRWDDRPDRDSTDRINETKELIKQVYTHDPSIALPQMPSDYSEAVTAYEQGGYAHIYQEILRRFPADLAKGEESYRNQLRHQARLFLYTARTLVEGQGEQIVTANGRRWSRKYSIVATAESRVKAELEREKNQRRYVEPPGQRHGAL